MITTPTEALVTLDNSQHQLAETDLARVDWKLNHIANPGMENWSTEHDIDDVSTYRTTEHYNWYATAPTWPVNELSRSRGFQARAIDPEHPSEAYMWRYSNPAWDNPTNLTLKFDWYIDQIPQPIDGDYFRIDIFLRAPGGDHHLYYYFGCSDSTLSNSSYARKYFFIDGPIQTWNTFDRNITEDFNNTLGYYPTEYRHFRFELMAYSSDYSRVFIDDLWMVNNTVIYGGSTGNGNFETSADWYSGTPNDAADIAQSSVSQEGDWSLNATANSNGNQTRLDVTYRPDRRLTSMNSDTFSFQWMMNEFDGANEDTFAYVTVSLYNGSESFQIFYNLAYGDNTNTYTWEGSRIINVTGFNTTGQWNTFSRSIWDDISSFNETDYVMVEEIEINIRARGPTSKISILFDDMKFESAAMDDMGYEDQGDIGDGVLFWDSSEGYSTELTVTDTANSGSKAANLTLVDGNSWGEGRYFENRLVNDNTDLWLDFYWRVENDSQHSDNLLYLETYFESGESLAYIFVNHTDVPTGNGFDEFMILPEVNINSTWINFQRNLYDDFVTVFGAAPDTKLEELYLTVESDTGGRLEVLFDDVYLYNDPAPEISVVMLPSDPEVNQDVTVSAYVNDLSALTVVLHYRVNESSWVSITMVDTGSGFNATIPGQPWDTQVDFYIEATDAFGQSSEIEPMTYQIPSEPTTSTTTTTTQPPDLTLLIVGVGVTIVIVGVVVVYYFVIRPKQSPA